MRDDTWIPDACELPTTERPLRLAEFDRFFAADVRSVQRLTGSGVRLVLAPDAAVAARAADLAVRETRCCAYFTFGLTATGGQVVLDVTAPSEHADVLDALAARATAGGRP